MANQYPRIPDAPDYTAARERPRNPFIPDRPRGLLEPGNIDLSAQPEVRNPDGSISTVDSSSFNFDGREYLLPSVTPDGRHLRTPQEVVDEFKRTGRHLGVFDSPETATEYAKRLHDEYAAGKYRWGKR
jgi:hypothetical protein